MIKGLSDRRRLPRAGIIRLGRKVQHPQTKNWYPEETDYFICPELVQEKYGPEPKELVVMFPVESEQVFFSQFYKAYGNGILLCRGNGESGTFWDFDKGDFSKRECPCEKLDKGECKPVATLQFLLPEIREAVGVWQISTSSKNSIIDVNSGIDFVRGIAGRVAMIPLLLKREPIDTHRIEGKNIKKGKHFTMKLSLGMSLVEIQKLGQIPAARALLPEPDESPEAVDDLFPKNGFKEDQDKKAEESEQEKPAEEAEPEQPKEENEEESPASQTLEELKEQLTYKVAEFESLGGKVKKAEFDKLIKIKESGTKAETQKAFDYYTTEIGKLQENDKQPKLV